MKMWWNLFVDLLAYERNEYRKSLPAGIKNDLSHITEKIYTVEFVSLRRHALYDYVNFTNLAFLLNVTLTSVIYFYSIIILSCDPCVFSTNV